MAALVYASEITLLSVGFTLTYLTAKVPNFAHGTYAGVGIYVSYTFSKIWGLSPYLGFPVSFVIGGIISVIIYKLVIGVLTNMGGGAIVLTISTLAIQIFLTALIQIYAYYLRERFSTYAMAFLLKEDDFMVAGFPGIFVVSLSLTVLSVIVLHIMLTRTKLGVAMRATAEDPELASVLGINIDQIQLFSWFLTGGLACLAGAMIPLWFQSTPQSGAMIITRIALNRPVTTLMVFACFVVIGAISSQMLPLEFFPDVDARPGAERFRSDRTSRSAPDGG